jgi:hypothetical protein
MADSPMKSFRLAKAESNRVGGCLWLVYLFLAAWGFVWSMFVILFGPDPMKVDLWRDCVSRLCAVLFVAHYLWLLGSFHSASRRPWILRSFLCGFISSAVASLLWIFPSRGDWNRILQDDFVPTLYLLFLLVATTCGVIAFWRVPKRETKDSPPDSTTAQ